MLKTFSDYIIFIDESGSAELANNSKLFVITAIIFHKQDYLRFSSRVLVTKFKTFGHIDIVLHHHEILRNKGEFIVFNNNEQLKSEFFKRYIANIQETDFKIISVIYDKEHAKQRGGFQNDLYSHLLGLVFTRAYHEINNNKDNTTILIEKRGTKKDNEVKQKTQKIISGENDLRYNKVMNFEVRLVDKIANLEGLQLADICASEIARWALQNNRLDHNLLQAIRQKFRCSQSGQTQGYGIITYPNSSFDFRHVFS